MSRRRTTAPLSILCASLAAGGAAWLDAGGPAQALLGVALVAVLPGAALIVLLGLRPVWPDALFATVACSVAITILAGIVLGLTRLGFDRTTWATTLAGIAAVLSGAGLARSVRAPAAVRHVRARAPAGGGDGSGRTEPRPALPILSLGLYAGAAAIAVLAIALAHSSAVDHARSARITALWMAPSSSPGGAGRVGVSVIGPQSGAYELELTAPGARRRRVGLALGPGGDRPGAIALPAGGQARLRGDSGLGPVIREVGTAQTPRAAQHRPAPRTPRATASPTRTRARARSATGAHR